MPELHLTEDGALDIRTFYQPFPKQAELHRNPAKCLLAIGGWGSGKSSFLLGEAIYTMSEYPCSDVLLLRRDYPELEKGLIHDFKELVPGGPGPLYTYNESKHIATWFNGSKLFFGHLQNASERTLSQYLSSAFVFIGIDELGQFSFEAWSFLYGRARINRGCQANYDGLMPIPRLAGATNPLGPGYGWIKKLWIEGKPVSQMGDVHKGNDGRFYSTEGGRSICVFDPGEYAHTHSTILDNPAQLEKDPGYIEKLEKLPPALRQKALYGDLHAVAGNYFSNFSHERNVRSLPRDRERIRFEPWQPVWLGFDWGLAHHTAIYWNTRAQILGLDNQWRTGVVTLREMVVNEDDYQRDRALGKHADDWNYKQYICEEIRRRTPDEERPKLRHIFLSPERFKRIDETSHTVAGELTQILRSMGLPMCSEANDAREDGAVLMYNLIDSGEWVILDSCPILISAIETRVRDDKKLEDVLKTEDELDDAYDSERYALLSMLKERGKPADVKLKEKLDTIADPTARMLYAFQHRLDEERRGQPIVPKYVPKWMTRR